MLPTKVTVHSRDDFQLAELEGEFALVKWLSTKRRGFRRSVCVKCWIGNQVMEYHVDAGAWYKSYCRINGAPSGPGIYAP